MHSAAGCVLWQIDASHSFPPRGEEVCEVLPRAECEPDYHWGSQQALGEGARTASTALTLTLTLDTAALARTDAVCELGIGASCISLRLERAVYWKQQPRQQICHGLLISNDWFVRHEQSLRETPRVASCSDVTDALAGILAEFTKRNRKKLGV